MVAVVVDAVFDKDYDDYDDDSIKIRISTTEMSTNNTRKWCNIFHGDTQHLMQILEIHRIVEISLLDFMHGYKCKKILQNINALKNIFKEIIT
jgi:hypothetical protein